MLVMFEPVVFGPWHGAVEDEIPDVLCTGIGDIRTRPGNSVITSMPPNSDSFWLLTTCSDLAVGPNMSKGGEHGFPHRT